MVKTKNWIQGLKQDNFTGALGRLIANGVKVIRNEQIRKDGQGDNYSSKEQIDIWETKEKTGKEELKELEHE